jgi:hypothetical protein
MQSNKKRASSEKGFALATALMACAILFALAILIIQLSTGDLRVSSETVGDKKASSAAETGIHRLMMNFDPANTAAAGATNVQVDAAADPKSRYSISNVRSPGAGEGPSTMPLSGYAIGGGQQWGQTVFLARVKGENTAYKSSVEIDVGMGFGPIEISTMSR